MRTVTFSQPKIQSAVQEHFVALTTNIEGDPTSGQSINHSPSEQPGFCLRGNGRQNVQVIFMTPDLEILHVTTGYIGPEDLHSELEFAAATFADIWHEPSEQRELQLRERHRSRLLQLGFSEREIGLSESERMAGMIRDLSSGSIPDLSSGTTPNAMGNVQDAMQTFSRSKLLADHQYVMANPLITRGQFESDPGALVGRGKTFFGSSQNNWNSRNR